MGTKDQFRGLRGPDGAVYPVGQIASSPFGIEPLTEQEYASIEARRAACAGTANPPDPDDYIALVMSPLMITLKYETDAQGLQVIAVCRLPPTHGVHIPKGLTLPPKVMTKMVMQTLQPVASAVRLLIRADSLEGGLRVLKQARKDKERKAAEGDPNDLEDATSPLPPRQEMEKP